MSDPTTCEAIPSAISSPALESGHSPCAWLAGTTLDLFGPGLAPVSRSALQPSLTSELVSTTNDICSLPGLISSASADLSFALASRLEAAMASLGSTVFSISWSRRATPALRQLPVQLVRARTTSEIGFTSLPTPCARDGKDITRSNAFLSQRKRHSPSLATRLLDSGHSWKVITAAYCLAMNLPLQWNAVAPAATVTRSTRAKHQSSSQQPTKP
ncbi:hypothetical protein SAMN05445871_4069 [Paraburkholderia caballeronis]|uniref:Uncharacterized protein n=1 Tax=Paraburkholderia caballeronis TaxID=416943 RepID=A0A1H7KYH3_9BURK|nr:hypothetical protein C7403_102110 [Paraburkholderia caballeronis]PXX03584.1 hypothetical protein C7407_102110 [Paraburkholderia caballeronis]RAK04328.1 hypothetical protein C7409_102110 [Paraburkholderia caballeronis]SED84583.1 hypothetical protein SAMN05445871_4069 [Paraburkholderia caballeronis]SEK91768.1 hypothetical protein SAMN05192542_104110 [Paraburkholderia caballeronis]